MVSRQQAVARLKAADWLARADLQAILNALDGGALRTRAVGGIVRDTLLGRPQTAADCDLATELLPAEVLARAEAAGIAAYPTGIEHGTVTLRRGAQTAEVTTLREDIETDGRRAVVRFGTDWVRDAERRDFTINALYANADGSLFDPLGGLDDCLSGRVRFIGDAALRVREDRLRVYRFFRFSASHGGQVLDPDGLRACRAAAGDLGALSAERVGAEMLRMLGLERIAATLKVMAAIGILDLDAATLRRLECYEALAAAPSGAARLAILIDAEDSEALQARWRLSNDAITVAHQTLAAARLIGAGALAEAAYRHPAQARAAVAVAAALSDWNSQQYFAATAALAEIEVPAFPISGSDLLALGMQPGKEIGATLARLEGDWIASGFRLDRTALLASV